MKPELGSIHAQERSAVWQGLAVLQQHWHNQINIGSAQRYRRAA